MMKRTENERSVITRPLKYILVTPARNEEEFIEGTIKSVIEQSVRPERWVIVSDGSSDRTDEIVQQYLDHYQWISLVRMPDRRDRSFAAKVNCFNAGYKTIQDVPHDIVGNLDADITFEPNYFQFLLEKFAENQNLGVAGTPFVEEGFKSYAHAHANLEHVSGACQLFRKECFQDIGGYVPNREGGIDWMAVTTARMTGWQTRTYQEKHCLHHRKIGTATAGPIQTRFKQGEKDYYLGGHPLWQIFRATFQLSSRPYVIGGSALLAGYLWSGLKRKPRPVSRELMQFHRKEQMIRLKTALKNIIRVGEREIESDETKDMT